MTQFYNNPLNNISNSNINNSTKSLEILNSVNKMDINYTFLNENNQNNRDFIKDLENNNNKKDKDESNDNKKTKNKDESNDKEENKENEKNKEIIKNTLLTDLELNINKEETQQLIKTWLDLDDEIEKLNLAIKERKNKQKKLNEIITRLMVSKNIPKFNTSTSDIILTERKQKKTLSTGLLLNLSTNYFENNSSKAENFIKYIDDNRGITIINNIKRKKKNMNKT